jgi:hypothetical protein
MGAGSRYVPESRNMRAASVGYLTKSASDIFTQIKEEVVHPSMDPKTIRLREARDSDINPCTYPIIYGQDVTGSMQKVPHELIKHGLPTMMSKIIVSGIESPSLLLLGLGDSQARDRAPFQVGQFENGDAEMDMWLERVYPEGGGGGNAGESYLWAWYFAAHHCETDAWDKRKQKGIIITFGDEPFLPIITSNEFQEVMGIERESIDAETLYSQAKLRWDIYHLHLTAHRATPEAWKDLLGSNLIEVEDFTNVPQIVADLCKKHCSYCGTTSPAPVTVGAPTEDEGEE